MEHSVFEILQKQLTEYKSEISEFLAMGYAKNMEEYNRMVGKVEVINRLSDDIQTLEKGILRHNVFMCSLSLFAGGPRKVTVSL